MDSETLERRGRRFVEPRLRVFYLRCSGESVKQGRVWRTAGTGYPMSRSENASFS